jgi:hypothetical protein
MWCPSQIELAFSLRRGRERSLFHVHSIKGQVSTQWIGGHQQPKPSLGTDPDTNLVVQGFLASRTVRKYISIVYATQSMVFCCGTLT